MASITAGGVGVESRNRNAEERGVRRAVGCRGKKTKNEDVVKR